MAYSRQSGFTLVELIVALAVAGILLAVGVPSFTEAIRNARLSSQYNDVVAALYLARSEAVKSADLVVVCARRNDASCGTADDWENGWLVFVDTTGNDTDTSVSLDAGDTLLRVQGPIPGENTITAYSVSTAGGSVSEDESAFVRYRPLGNAHWDTGSVRICDAKRGAVDSRVINVVLTGDIRPGRQSGGSGAPRDVAGREIVCPAASS